MKVEAIVPAAGLGARLKSSTPKPLVRIGGRPIIIHTLEALASSKRIKRIIIAANKPCLKEFDNTLKRYKIKKDILLIEGGGERKDSVKNCLAKTYPDTELVLIHDAVRPFIRPDMIDRLIATAYQHGAAICAVPIKGTVKKMEAKSGSRCKGRAIDKTLDRSLLWEAQTPQVFKKEILFEAYEKYGAQEATDESSLVERTGAKVKAIEGSYFNIKITTPEDLIFARAILRQGYV